MNCPVCDERMREVEKYNVRLDICPGCKGVWLDRGELEKLLDFAATDGAKPVTRPTDVGPSMAQEKSHDHDHEHRKQEHDQDRRQAGGHGFGERKKRGSWLGDILGGIGGGED
jgi:Zn-finger nucleic acid-binding protein